MTSQNESFRGLQKSKHKPVSKAYSSLQSEDIPKTVFHIQEIEDIDM